MGETDNKEHMIASQPAGMRRNDVSMSEMSDLDAGDDGVYHVRKSRLIRLINWWQVSVLGFPFAGTAVGLLGGEA